MQVHDVISTLSSPRLAVAISCASLALGVAAPASAATPYEVVLASPSQALTYCQSGKMPSNDIAYISDSSGAVQFGPGFNCVQQNATKKLAKTMTAALLVANSGAVKECKLAKPKSAVALCNTGALGTYDIAYISGKLYNTIGGQGYGCGFAKHVGGIGNAICK